MIILSFINCPSPAQTHLFVYLFIYVHSWTGYILILSLMAMFIFVFSLHNATCGLKIKVIYDLMPWDEGPLHLPTDRKPSTVGKGFQQNSEKCWPYKIFTIIFWAIQSHQKCMEIISVWFFCIFFQKSSTNFWTLPRPLPSSIYDAAAKSCTCKVK
jgi:hypothetical protein